MPRRKHAHKGKSIQSKAEPLEWIWFISSKFILILQGTLPASGENECDI